MKNIFLFIILMLLLAGCSPVEGVRRIAGTSIEALQEEQKGRFAIAIPHDFYWTASRVWDVLEENGIYIYLTDWEENYLIAMHFHNIFPRCIDTTEVGIFFKNDTGDCTIVEVVSQNRSLAKFVSVWLENRLNNPLPSASPES